MPIVAIHANRAAHQLEHAQWLAEGLRAHNWSIMPAGYDRPEIADMMAVWGWRQKNVIRAARAAGVPLLVMERGYVGDRLAMTSIGFDGLNGRAKFPLIDDGGERLGQVCGVKLEPPREGGGYILLLGQVPGDASLDGVDIRAWEDRAAKVLSKFGIVFYRPHPLMRGYFDCPPAAMPDRHKSLETALRGAAWAVTYNSNSGVDASLAGVPVIAMDQGSMAWPIAGHDLNEVPPAMTSHGRAKWAERLAWCQWSPEEISSGAAWHYLAQVAQQGECWNAQDPFHEQL